MATIDLSNLPIEPTITIIDNHENEVVTTNNPVAVLYARVQIKHLGLVGFRIRTSSGIMIPILPSGKLAFWPKGYQIPGDIFESLLMELI